MNKNRKKERELELEIFRKSLENIDQKDFDGHTDFDKLSVREKMLWLSELNDFRCKVHDFKSRKKN